MDDENTSTAIYDDPTVVALYVLHARLPTAAKCRGKTRSRSDRSSDRHYGAFRNRTTQAHDARSATPDRRTPPGFGGSENDRPGAGSSRSRRFSAFGGVSEHR